MRSGCESASSAAGGRSTDVGACTLPSRCCESHANEASSIQIRPRRIFPFLRWWPMVNRNTTRADLMAGTHRRHSRASAGRRLCHPCRPSSGIRPLCGHGAAGALGTVRVELSDGRGPHQRGGDPAIREPRRTSLPPGSPDYIRLVLTVTLLTGVFELVMGIARLGALVNFISHTVIIGFSAGAAILIATSQIKSFFGIPIPPEASFVETLRQLALQVGHINPWVTSHRRLHDVVRRCREEILSEDPVHDQRDRRRQPVRAWPSISTLAGTSPASGR